ncbi:Solute carrier family 23 member 1 [Holothuria leucospilota]|uniref:Solute carrier family 23 member 1 n=1 Tax=Holothuria leucospilota TaxID=206669 RepID=A0A9Q1HEZ7_HOLLE|nr:Solute carrier family 23 member 1 [Holothuria leucospilota]
MSMLSQFQKIGESMEKEEDLHDGKGASTSPQMSDLAYRIDERPPWMMTIMMAVQVLLLFCGLPIIQGPGAGFIIPAIAALSVRGECPAELTANSTQQERDRLKEEAYNRLNEVQGSVLVASIIQCLIGFTGLMGIFLRYIGPITIAVTLVMIGIGVIPLVMNLAGSHWCISIPTIALVIFFSKILPKWKIPCLGGKQLRLLEFFPVRFEHFSLFFITSFIVRARSDIASVTF